MQKCIYTNEKVYASEIDAESENVKFYKSEEIRKAGHNNMLRCCDENCTYKILFRASYCQSVTNRTEEVKIIIINRFFAFLKSKYKDKYVGSGRKTISSSLD